MRSRDYLVILFCTAISFWMFSASVFAGPKLSREDVQALYRIFNDNDLGGMERLLDQGMDVDADMGGGVTLLLKAANIGTADMVALLIKKGADVNRLVNTGENALMQALSNSRHYAGIVFVLLDAGVEVKVTNQRNGYNPVWKALQKIRKGFPGEPGFSVLTQVLERGADPNAPFITTNQKLSGLTPLMQAAGKGQVQVVKLLLAYGADGKAATSQGKTVSDFAREKGHHEVFSILAHWQPGQAKAVKDSLIKGGALEQASAEDLKKSCQGDPREPWCYQEKVEDLGDPALCEPILDYWPNAVGVHGWCYYRLATLLNRCPLCEKIKKQDIYRTCRREVCQ